MAKSPLADLGSVELHQDDRFGHDLLDACVAWESSVPGGWGFQVVLPATDSGPVTPTALPYAAPS